MNWVTGAVSRDAAPADRSVKEVGRTSAHGAGERWIFEKLARELVAFLLGPLGNRGAGAFNLLGRGYQRSALTS